MSSQPNENDHDRLVRIDTNLGHMSESIARYLQNQEQIDEKLMEFLEEVRKNSQRLTTTETALSDNKLDMKVVNERSLKNAWTIKTGLTLLSVFLTVVLSPLYAQLIFFIIEKIKS